ncbi:oligosaccharide flippase family protein [Haliscomenobacter sp.]|uniref:lipopolysaccharide biosynthesis protein n=1 Tax=Haliscomenobacter sp. TaxID=2717303 RepID=UPI003364FBC9
MKGEIDGYTNKTRDRNFNSQILISLFLKGASILLSLILVPLYIKFLGQESYGVWLTLIASANWIIFMDIGIGNGMRNKISESLSAGDYDTARAYVSTSYISLGAIVLATSALVLLLFSFLNFSAIFNTQAIDEFQLKLGTIVVVLSVIFNFLLSLSNSILNALQKNSFISLSLIFSNLLILIIFLIFSANIAPNAKFLFVAGGYSFSLLAGSILLSFFTFKYNPRLTPSFRLFERDKIRNIASLGGRFFILEIAVVVVLTTDSLIISHLFGAAEVTPYYVTQKIFQVATILASILVQPLWSASTEAFSKGDLDWIKNKLKFLLKVFVGYVVFVLGIIVFFQPIKNIWVGETVAVPDSLIWFMGLYVVLWFWNNIFNKVLNGLSILYTQILVAVVGIIINIPLCFLFAKTLNMGLSGIVMGAIVILIFAACIYPIQSYLLLENKAKGIWAKK